MTGSGETGLPGGTPDRRGADPGLARQRTALAWTRTAVSFAALGAAVLKARPVPGLAILAVSALVYPFGRYGGPQDAADQRHRRVLITAIAVTGVSVAALIISLLAGS